MFFPLTSLFLTNSASYAHEYGQHPGLATFVWASIEKYDSVSVITDIAGKGVKMVRLYYLANRNRESY